MEPNKRNDMNLKDITLSKIAITLWTCSDMTIKLLNNYHNPKDWMHIAKMLYEYHDLTLPVVLKTKVDKFLPFIGLEIFKLVDYLLVMISLDTKSLKYVLSKIFWKTKGIIDRKKTVEILTGEKTLSVSTRYKLACAFCLEEDILKLWSMLPVDKKSLFRSISDHSEKYIDIVTIWSLYNVEQSSIISTKSIKQGFASVFLYEFLCSIHEGIPEAVVYYWQKILHEEKFVAISEAMIILEKSYVNLHTMCTNCELDYRFVKRLLDEIVVFLFNQTGDEYLETLGDELEFYIFRVLSCFLELPVLEFFINTFEKLQPFFKRKDFFNIIKLLEYNIFNHRESKDKRYLLILKEVWTKSSETNKESIYFYLPSLISTILTFNDQQFVSLILKDLPPSVREGLMFSDEGISECLELANDEAWDLLELIINMCVRQEKLEDFKSLFGNQIQAEVVSLCNSSKSKVLKAAFRVHNFIDDIIKNNGYANPPSKKFCSDVKFKIT